ncbi:MAG: ribosome-binding factor A, partial [Pseudomonadota bacterium]
MSKRRFDHGPGPSQRQLRVGELIRRTLSDVLMRGDTHEPSLEGVSITVGEVRTSPDLRVATVYVLPLGGANSEAVLAGLKAARGELRRAVNRAVK